MPAQGKHAKADSTKSRWLPWLLVALVACVVIVAQTLSVITREMPLETRVQFGTVDVKAVITTKNAAGEEVEASNGDELGKGVAHISRIVRMENTGDHPVFARMKIGFECVDAQGQAHAIDDLVNYTYSDAYDPAGGVWMDRLPQSDGFFYLKEALPENAVSEPLITGFEVNTEEAVARYGEGCTFQLVVDCYGVQSKNQKSENVLEAEGWPA